MSVTYYLTDHNGKQVAFFYRIENERYRTCPQILWACRQHPQFQGTASSKGDFIEQAKQALKEIKKLETLPVRKTCDDCGLTISGKDFESQDDCPDCLINNR
jgi:hypothetical protein